MTGPLVAIGGLTSLGIKKQSAFGTPAAPTAAAGQWSYLLTNSLAYDRALAVQEVGAGQLDPTQFIEGGLAKSKGGFEDAMTGNTGMERLAFFMGVGSDTPNTTGVFSGQHNHVLTPQVTVQPVTIEDQWVSHSATPDGQSYRLDDCFMDTFKMGYAAGKGWSLTFTVLGGLGSTPITPPTVPTYPGTPDLHILQWGHVSAVTLPGSIPAKHCLDLTLMGARNLQQVPGAGSFNPTDAASGKVNTTGSFDCVFGTAAAATAYAAWMTDTEQTIGWTIAFGDVTAATTARQVVVACTRCRMMAPSKKWAIGSLTALSVPFTLLDSGNNLTITATNPTAAAYT